VSTRLPPTTAALAPQPDSGADRRTLEAGLFFGFAVFSAIVAILASAMGGASTDEILMVCVALATILLALIPVTINHRNPPAQRHVLLMVFALSWACFYAFPLFTQYFLGDPLQESVAKLLNLDTGDILIGQAVAMLGLACLYVGYVYPLGRYVGGLFPRPTKEWPHPTALFIAITMIFLGWTVFLGQTVGLIPRSFGSGVLGTIASSMYFGIGLLAIIHIRYRSQPAQILMFLLVPLTMAIAFLTGSKRFALSPLIVIVIVYIVIERRLRLRWVLGGLFALIMLYPLTEFWRGVAWGGTTTLIQWILDPGRVIDILGSLIAASDFGDYFTRGLIATGNRLDLLGITTIIVRDTPSRVPYQDGWSLAYIPLSFIPRIIWAGKPHFNTGQWVTDHYGGGPHIQSSTGSGWVGELYFNFGIVGVVVGMLIIGTVFRVFHETLFRTDATIPALLAALIVVWVTCPQIEANLLSPFSGGVFHLTPILLTHLFVRGLGVTTTPVVPRARAPTPGTT